MRAAWDLRISFLFYCLSGNCILDRHSRFSLSNRSLLKTCLASLLSELPTFHEKGIMSLACTYET